MPYVAAKEKLFFGPFAKTTATGIPWFGIVVSTAVASVLMGYSYTGGTGLKVVTYLVGLSVVTVAIPYFFSACAQLAYLVSRRRKVHGAVLARDLFIAGLSILFSLWVTAASGYQAVYQALLLVLVGIPIYSFLKASKEKAGLVPEPVDRIRREDAGAGR
jgi:APA family basic amino acid/polyamine antiporter